jgi:hypothetical protein
MRNIVAALFALTSAIALAQDLPKFSYPDPETYTKAALVLCKEQRDSLVLAFRYREAGRSKEEALAQVPANSPSWQFRVIDMYRENIENVYTYPQYGLYSMLVFRAESCRKEVMAVRRLPKFETVHEQVAACEAKHGKDRSSELLVCVRNIVEAM